MSVPSLNAVLYFIALFASVTGTYLISSTKLQIHSKQNFKIQVCVISTLLAAFSCCASLFFENRVANRALKFIANLTSISSDFLVFDIAIFVFASAYYGKSYKCLNFLTISFLLGLLFAIKIEYQYENEIFNYYSNSCIAIFDAFVICFDFSIFGILIRVYQLLIRELNNKVNVMHEKLLAKMGVSTTRPTTSGPQVRALELFVIEFSYNLAFVFAIFWVPFLVISVADLRMNEYLLVARWFNIIVGSSKGVLIYYAYKWSQVRYEQTLKRLITDFADEGDQYSPYKAEFWKKYWSDSHELNTPADESDPLLLESAICERPPLDDLFDYICNHDHGATMGLPNSFRRPIYKPIKDLDGSTVLMLQQVDCTTLK